jgi:hypothetical protein
MEIIVDNLKDDTAQLQLIIFKNENKVRTLGTLLSFQDTDNPDTLRSDFFNAVFLRSFSTWYFFSNNAAIEQMKSSESLRLVKNKTVLDGIFNYGYENNIIAINHAYADMWVNRGTENGSRFLKFRNVFPSLKSIALAQNNVIGNMPRKYHVEGMLEFFNDAAAHRAVLSSFYVRDLRNQQKNAAALISLLQKEYHLEDE